MQPKRLFVKILLMVAVSHSSQFLLRFVLTQQRPLLGQSVSLWPGLQQVDTAPAHSASERGEAAGHWPASSPPSDPPDAGNIRVKLRETVILPAVPKAPSARPYSPALASQSTLNLNYDNEMRRRCHVCHVLRAVPTSIINWYLMWFNCSWCINDNVINKQKEGGCTECSSRPPPGVMSGQELLVRALRWGCVFYV